MILFFFSCKFICRGVVMGFWSPLAMIMYDMSDDYDSGPSGSCYSNDENPTCLFEPIIPTHLPFCLETMKTIARLSCLFFFSSSLLGLLYITLLPLSSANHHISRLFKGSLDTRH
ncbi:hypothetical protein BDW42DRAFT_9839 [Aspergillus taichungensis]|uniref:Uncharacterized protein n=1 Tax=Aspergillus taichungensis TaxID=482145 RepID=A0A2J5I5B4_9EURO|nr:hypothetical protein BDW42DRAFT_9839 [Aspergillus taichungensis]